MVGRNNTENDYLTFKLATKSDIWFHTKDIPGSHVVLFLRDKEAEEMDILQAASLAAYHSKAKESENVPVNYTKIKYIKKLPESKPGMVIFTNNKTVYVNPENNENLKC
jgi:predicted ribosome quality control (RQC) complex YloA/Tae2 family protein